MEYRPTFNIKPFTFFTVFPASLEDPYYIITQHSIDAATRLYVEDYPPSMKTHTFFSIGQVGLNGYVSKDAQQIGFLLHSKYPSRNLAASVIAYTEAQKGQLGELQTNSRLVLRTSLFYLYNIINVATLACNSKTASRIHDTLTSV
jgi:hypothetical protein